MAQITKVRTGLFDRLFRKPILLTAYVQEGAAAAEAEERTGLLAVNRYAKGTLEHKSWQKGYDDADTSGYVW